MSVIVPGDRGYRQAKRARQGRSHLNARFDGFVAAFREQFGSAPLWLETDRMRQATATSPRLNIVLERTRQYEEFLSAGGNFDPAKQRTVARLLAENLSDAQLRSLFRVPVVSPADLDWAEETFVCFSEFERVAKQEAHASITAPELDTFTGALGLGDRLWCTRCLSGPPIVFVHTEAQATELRTSPLPEGWADTYFTLVRTHDEFGYLERAEISIQVDSRENFEKTYDGNWYYYFK